MPTPGPGKCASISFETPEPDNAVARRVSASGGNFVPSARFGQRIPDHRGQGGTGPYQFKYFSRTGRWMLQNSVLSLQLF